MLVRSGGQTGADESGLYVAHFLGIPTGGVMPKGFKTLKGPRPDLAAKYNLTEHESERYPPRTYQNVKDADATIRIYTNPNSPGEILTLKAIKQYNKPYFDIDLRNPPEIEEVINFLTNNEIQVLNIAGNSEKTSPGIFEKACKILFKILKSYKEQNDL